jgi:hypothetical protein
MEKAKQQGLLSFLFHVRHDARTRQELHQNEKAAMMCFGLSEAAQALIVEIGELASSGSNSPMDQNRAHELWKQLLDEYLVKELLSDQGAIW